jgi:hypothetical protein
MPKMFTNEEHADMHFEYSFCSENDTAAVVEYQQQYLLQRIPHCKTSRMYTEF